MNREQLISTRTIHRLIGLLVAVALVAAACAGDDNTAKSSDEAAPADSGRDYEEEFASEPAPAPADERGL